MLVIN